MRVKMKIESPRTETIREVDVEFICIHVGLSLSRHTRGRSNARVDVCQYITPCIRN